MELRRELHTGLYHLSAENLDDKAITTAKLDDDAVTLEKLADEVRQRIMLDAW